MYAIVGVEAVGIGGGCAYTVTYEGGKAGANISKAAEVTIERI